MLNLNQRKGINESMETGNTPGKEKKKNTLKFI